MTETENRLPVFFRYRFLWHLLFWFVVFIVYWIHGAEITGQYKKELTISLAVLPAKIIGTYSFIYLLLPLVTEKNNYVLFGFLMLVHFFIYGFLVHFSYHLLNAYPEFYDYSQQPVFNTSKIIAKGISAYVVPAAAAIIVLFKKWYLDQEQNKRLVEEKTTAELKFLKSQIHPHFLFNTLNNLYALTLIESEKTPDIVLKLSDLLDYMIYKSNDMFVPLEKELEILEGYIELEKMRYHERLNLSYNVSGDVNSHKIAPLILLPFIENSFKHGARKDRVTSNINIRIEIKPEYFHMLVQNSLPAKDETDEPEEQGIGLRNVKRRLELIYPGRHGLITKKEDDTYWVDLMINWSK